MRDAARTELSDEEGEDRAEEYVMHLEEIAGPNVFGMIAEEG